MTLVDSSGWIEYLADHLALEHGLAMADAVIYATARRHDATVVTADSDFEGLPGTVVLR